MPVTILLLQYKDVTDPHQDPNYDLNMQFHWTSSQTYTLTQLP